MKRTQQQQVEFNRIKGLAQDQRNANDLATLVLLEPMEDYVEEQSSDKRKPATKEQWNAPENVAIVEGKVKFITPSGADKRKTVTIELEENVSDVIEDIFDSAKDSGIAKPELPYGMKKEGRKRINVRLHEDMLDGLKTGHIMTVGIEARIADKTTYFNKKDNSSFFHEETGLSISTVKFMSNVDEVTKEDNNEVFEKIKELQGDQAAAFVNYLKR